MAIRMWLELKVQDIALSVTGSVWAYLHHRVAVTGFMKMDVMCWCRIVKLKIPLYSRGIFYIKPTHHLPDEAFCLVALVSRCVCHESPMDRSMTHSAPLKWQMP